MGRGVEVGMGVGDGLCYDTGGGGVSMRHSFDTLNLRTRGQILSGDNC